MAIFNEHRGVHEYIQFVWLVLMYTSNMSFEANFSVIITFNLKFNGFKIKIASIISLRFQFRKMSIIN